MSPNDPPSNISQQTRIQSAIQRLEQADSEVDRLCTIIERTAVALTAAREVKRLAQIELDQASRANGSWALDNKLRNHVTKMDGVGRDLLVGSASFEKRLDTEESSVEYNEGTSEKEGNSDYESSQASDEDVESIESGLDYDDASSEDEEEEEPNNDLASPTDFDMDNEALDHLRYRLKIAKIDPISAVGKKLLDELLIRFQKTKEPITFYLVNRFIDELLDEEKNENSLAEVEGSEFQEGSGYASSFEGENIATNDSHGTEQSKRIRINRGGKVLGWYEGQLDSRCYAREGKGSMYYDAGHECHGMWENDEMIGRGTYIWADGHKYDGEWKNGKRHGLGRFIRPDGVILYGRYENGHHRGEGVRWSADRKEAQSMVDGVPNKSVSLSIAEFMALKLGFNDVPPPLISKNI